VSTSLTTLIILDGFGHREASDSNAIALAETPFLDALYARAPHTLISGSGLDVGLPEGQMGNSEVGHMNLGAGRVVHQEFTRINQAIRDRRFFANAALNLRFQAVAAQQTRLHIFGLLSPGGVHSHENQIYAAIESAVDQGVRNLSVHAFLDGRDVAPKSAIGSIERLQALLTRLGTGQIDTLAGRYYAMDRDHRWDRVQRAYDTICFGESEHIFNDPVEAVKAAYARGETDEFVQPSVLSQGGDLPRLSPGDDVLFMNFRADRARQLTEAFVSKTFEGFPRKPATLGAFTTLTQYAENLPVTVAFPPETINNSLGEHLANLKRPQLRIAETEKYAHVTFFFSCGQEQPFDLEERILIPSPEVSTYDLQPAMSAPLVTDALCNAISEQRHQLIVCNYANGDMVGHTGNLAAAIEAVETLDASLCRVVAAAEAAGNHVLITADHGNCEQMNDHLTGQPHTAHTCELVPLIYVGTKDVTLHEHGKLSDIAPTLLELMDLPIPGDMTGRSLLASPRGLEADAS